MSQEDENKTTLADGQGEGREAAAVLPSYFSGDALRTWLLGDFAPPMEVGQCHWEVAGKIVSALSNCKHLIKSGRS